MPVTSVNDSRCLRNLKPSLLDQFCKRAFLAVLGRIRYGRLTLEENGDTLCFGEQATATDLVAHIQIHHPSAYRDCILRGSIGSGEAYMLGSWSSPDLTKVTQIFVRNRHALLSMDSGLANLSKPLFQVFHALRPNSSSQARHNIAAHYDLGNDFFSLFLDPTMMYSSAIYQHAGQNLDEAAVHKLQTICEKLQLKPSDHLLEIGTGWGGMALFAAQRYGCRVTTTTISREQFNHAKGQVDAAGLSDRITVLCEDYRDLKGQYDKLVSIEMIEAVGHQYYESYFRQCSALLKPQGLMLIQGITIADAYYERAKKSVDFIQRYIFPGGCLPSISVIANHIARHTDMQLIGLHDITFDYALTLQHWRQRFFAREAEVRALGFDDVFIRMWEYYLCYCEGGFLERSIGTQQFLLAKPAYRPT